MSDPIDYANLPTPPAAVADFCLIPVSPDCVGHLSPSSMAFIKQHEANASYQIGTPTASVSNEVAAVQRLMKASGLSYSMHSAGTTVGMLIFNRSSTPLRLFLNDFRQHQVIAFPL